MRAVYVLIIDVPCVSAVLQRVPNSEHESAGTLESQEGCNDIQTVIRAFSRIHKYWQI